MITENKPCAWMSVLHMPHPKVKNLKKVHRLVVLPDFQGIGIGSKFLNLIAKHYQDSKFRFGITTTNPSLIKHLKKNAFWRCVNIGKFSPHSGALKSKKLLNNRLKVSFEYK